MKKDFQRKGHNNDRDLRFQDLEQEQHLIQTKKKQDQNSTIWVMYETSQKLTLEFRKFHPCIIQGEYKMLKYHHRLLGSWLRDKCAVLKQVCTNGFVSFGSSRTSTSGSIPLDSGPPVIAANWRDLNTYSSGLVYYRSTSSGKIIKL